jgi:hypothetical protein
MYEPQTLTLLDKITTDDGIGGVEEAWEIAGSIVGYIDLLAGTDQAVGQIKANNAWVEESTHIAIITDSRGLEPNDKQGLIDSKGKEYEITYSDDPVGVGHHRELYLRYRGEL